MGLCGIAVALLYRDAYCLLRLICLTCMCKRKHDRGTDRTVHRQHFTLVKTTSHIHLVPSKLVYACARVLCAACCRLSLLSEGLERGSQSTAKDVNRHHTTASLLLPLLRLPKQGVGCKVQDEVSISDTIISDTIISDTVISNTKSSDTIISDTIISDTKSSDTTISDTIISDTKSSDTIISGTKSSDTIISNTIISNTKSSDTIISDTVLSDAIISYTIMC